MCVEINRVRESYPLNKFGSFLQQCVYETYSKIKLFSKQVAFSVVIVIAGKISIKVLY